MVKSFRRPFHQAIAKLATDLDAQFLLEAQCYFGGGSQFALSLGEYRESMDIDFLCSSREGFRKVRETVSENSLGKLVRRPVPLARHINANRDGIRTAISVDGCVIKLEVVLEARLDLRGKIAAPLALPTLDLDLCVAEKFLANVDRGLDEHTRCRDLVDLAYLAAKHGPAPLRPGLMLAEDVYGTAVRRYLGLVLKKLNEPVSLARIAKSLALEDPRALAKGVGTLSKLLRSRPGRGETGRGSD